MASPEVDSKQLEKYVRHLSEELPERIGQESPLNKTAEWIEKQLAPYGKPYRQSYDVNGETFHNIFIDFGKKTNLGLTGTDKELIIIGAHYDTAHGFPGADDNASGVAGLIELAFYTLEEPPNFRTKTMGSYVHARQLKVDEEKVKLMIAIDMIGYFTDEQNSQHLPFPLMDKVYSNKGNFISIIGDLSNMLAVRNVKSHFKSATDLPVYSFNAPKFIEGIDFSDHLNFWHHDYPAVMVTDTSFNRNKNYHTAEDTAEKLDYLKMAEVVKALYQTALALSSARH